MVAIKKTNAKGRDNVKATADHPTCNIEQASALRVFLAHAGDVRQAALMLVCAGVSYLLTVNHFARPGDEKTGYLSVSKATEYMTDMLRRAKAKGGAEIGNGMLDIYVRNAKATYQHLIGSGTKFADVIKKFSEHDDATTAPEIILDWLSSRGVTSNRELSHTLGYSTGRPVKSEEATPASVAKRIETSMAAVIKMAETKPSVIREAATAIVNKSDGATRLAIVLQAINTLADYDALLQIAKAANAAADKLAEAEAPKKAKAVRGAAAKGRGRKAPVEVRAS